MPINARSREILIFGTLGAGVVAFIYYIGRRSYAGNQNPAFFYNALPEPVFPKTLSAAGFLKSLAGDFPHTTPVAPWAPPPSYAVSVPSGTVPADWPSGGNWGLSPDAISNALALGGGAWQTTGAGDQGGPGNAAAGSGQQGNAGSTNQGFGLASRALGLLGGPAFGPVTGAMSIIGNLAQEGFLGPNLQGNQNANINVNPAAYVDFANEQPGFLSDSLFGLNPGAISISAQTQATYDSSPNSDPSSDFGNNPGISGSTGYSGAASTAATGDTSGDPGNTGGGADNGPGTGDGGSGAP